MSSNPLTVYTVGHSNHELPHFLSLLNRHKIDAIVDVRSSPYSQYCPWFNREPLQLELAKVGVHYLFFGPEFGARRDEPECYVEGRVSFDEVRRTQVFQDGIRRLEEGAARYRVALMCSEKDPIDCHRTILVARDLLERDFCVLHILADGEMEEAVETVRRIMRAEKVPEADLFQPVEELVKEAYTRRSARISWEQAPQEVEGDVERS